MGFHPKKIQQTPRVLLFLQSQTPCPPHSQGHHYQKHVDLLCNHRTHLKLLRALGFRLAEIFITFHLQEIPSTSSSTAQDILTPPLTTTIATVSWHLTMTPMKSVGWSSIWRSWKTTAGIILTIMYPPVVTRISPLTTTIAPFQ